MVMVFQAASRGLGLAGPAALMSLMTYARVAFEAIDAMSLDLCYLSPQPATEPLSH